MNMYQSENLPLIEKEEARLADVLQTIRQYGQDRKDKLASFWQELDALKKERLDAVSWQEKNRLTEKLRDKEAYNPHKYLPEFSQEDSPYFASFAIEDNDSRIKQQEFLLGKQSLFKDSKVVIIDWRQAAVSALYYEYEAGEEYEEEINGTERTGLLAEKNKYTIKARELLHIESSNGEVYEKRSAGWRRIDEKRTTSTDKQDSADHHLVDIVSLISPDQFRLITREYHGCLRLQGSAGAGKTTIALHRLSYLVFNYPEKFRVDRCLVLMFNRALRDYVSVTVDEMLGRDAQVETFHTWALRSLRSLGLRKISLVSNVAPSEFDSMKKTSGMAELIKEYAQSAGDAVAVEHLLRMYSSEALLTKFLSTEVRPALIKKFTDYYRQRLENLTNTNEIAFSDVGILLRLFQLRTLKKNPSAENFALNYFDHLVIDEAQDFSQVELECLFAASSRERSLTICADPNQQILSFVDSSGLKNFELQLRKSGVTEELLEVSYRSTAEIMEVANMVIGKGPETGGRKGEPVIFRRCSTKDEALTSLKETVLVQQEQSPNGLIAVVCRQKNQVNYVYEALKIVPGTRKEPQRFQPGILVTNAHQVKGLEFTAVVAWNVSAHDYRASNAQDRNLLYVVLSRACDRLAIFCHEEPSSYIKELAGNR